MKDQPLAQESAPARAKPKEPDPDGFCHNCGVELHGFTFCVTPGDICRKEWERFQRK